MMLRACLGILLPLWLAAMVNASALTTTISPNEKLCFYADVDKAGEKIGVRLRRPTPFSDNLG
jgi:hypothetical protein